MNHDCCEEFDIGHELDGSWVIRHWLSFGKRTEQEACLKFRIKYCPWCGEKLEVKDEVR